MVVLLGIAVMMGPVAGVVSAHVGAVGGDGGGGVCLVPCPWMPFDDVCYHYIHRFEDDEGVSHAHIDGEC